MPIHRKHINQLLLSFLFIKFQRASSFYCYMFSLIIVTHAHQLPSVSFTNYIPKEHITRKIVQINAHLQLLERGNNYDEFEFLNPFCSFEILYAKGERWSNLTLRKGGKGEGVQSGHHLRRWFLILIVPALWILGSLISGAGKWEVGMVRDLQSVLTFKPSFIQVIP